MIPRELLFEHMRYNLAVGLCNHRTAYIEDCDHSGGWCDICKHQIPSGINWMDLFQFFTTAEDISEDHTIDLQDIINCAENIGAVPVRIL